MIIALQRILENTVLQMLHAEFEATNRIYVGQVDGSLVRSVLGQDGSIDLDANQVFSEQYSIATNDAERLPLENAITLRQDRALIPDLKGRQKGMYNDYSFIATRGTGGVELAGNTALDVVFELNSYSNNFALLNVVQERFDHRTASHASFLERVLAYPNVFQAPVHGSSRREYDEFYDMTVLGNTATFNYVV